MIVLRRRFFAGLTTLLILGLFLGSLSIVPKVYAATTIPVGAEPQAIGYAFGNNQLYVANSVDNTVSVINGSTGTVVKTIGVGVDPDAVAFSLLRGRIYVADAGDNNITLISTANNKVVPGASAITVGGRPSALYYNLVNNYLYVANEDDGTVTLIQTTFTGNTVVGDVAVGSQPVAMAFDPVNNALYVVNSGDDTVSVLDTKSNAVTATIPVGSNPQSVAYAGASNLVYVANADDNNVSVISPLTGKVVKDIAVGLDPQSLVYAPTNGVVYVANLVDNNVSLISATKNKVIKTVAVGNSPIAMAFDSQNSNVYVANIADNTVSVLSTFSTTATCNKDSAVVGTAVRCTATVIGTAPTGKVTWTSTGTGRFLSPACQLAAGACSVTYIPTSTGLQALMNASYAGNPRNSKSFGTTVLGVDMRTTKVAASCVPAATKAGAARPVKCTATVVGYKPTGTVTFSQYGNGSFAFSPSTCSLVKGRCFITMVGETPGKTHVQATYGGDLNNTGSTKVTSVTILRGRPLLTVSCGLPSLLLAGSAATCTATLKNFPASAVNETITWSRMSGTGALTILQNTCQIAPDGTCSVNVHLTGVGSVALKASYAGDLNSFPALKVFTLKILTT